MTCSWPGSTRIGADAPESPLLPPPEEAESSEPPVSIAHSGLRSTLRIAATRRPSAAAAASARRRARSSASRVASCRATVLSETLNSGPSRSAPPSARRIPGSRVMSVVRMRSEVDRAVDGPAVPAGAEARDRLGPDVGPRDAERREPAQLRRQRPLDAPPCGGRAAIGAADGGAHLGGVRRGADVGGLDHDERRRVLGGGGCGRREQRGGDDEREEDAVHAGTTRHAHRRHDISAGTAGCRCRRRRSRARTGGARRSAGCGRPGRARRARSGRTARSRRRPRACRSRSRSA